MKILQLSNKLPYPSLDGGSLAIRSLAEGYAVLGHEVLILAMNTHKHFVEPNSIPPLPDRIRMEIVSVPALVQAHSALFNLLFSSLPYSIARFSHPGFAAKLHSILSQEAFDLIQIEGLYCTSYIPLIQSLTKAKILYRTHNIESEIWTRLAANESSYFKRFYYRNLAKRLDDYERKILNTYDALIPITSRDAEVYQKLGNVRPAKIIPFALETETLISFPIAQNPTIDFFHLGSLDWSPNQEGLRWFGSEIWTPFQTKHPDLSFFIAGRNSPDLFRKEMEQLPGVVFCGEIENAREFIAQHQIMIVPLLSGSGMRVKIIEGMLAEKCIITTTVGIEGISAINGIHCLIADSPDGMIRLMEDVVNHPDLIEKIGKEARIFALSNFDRNSISQQLIDFAEKLIQD
jgi:polysaccharide biosynthesis protein PslH